MTSILEVYLAKVEADYRRGIATEHTYRSALEWLLENLAPGVEASNDPRHIACGAPDFIVERRKIPVGYVETKDVGIGLDRIEKTEQLKRYLAALNNFILTDYLEFRWYVNGAHRLTARIALPDKKGRLAPSPEGMALAEQMFRQFYQTEAPTVTTAKDLATRLAQKTHLVRDLIINALKAEDEAPRAALEKQYKTFRELLLPALKPEEFADLYAQTMAYGLFAAKLSAPEHAPFSALAAYQYLGANRFLRKLFLDVGEELDNYEIIRPYLEDIVVLLNHADFASILAGFRTKDLIVHFYETFLSVYDPKMRESRGVYYTPEPVVQFIVNSVHQLLVTRFQRPLGLAAENVKVLDPATGTGTFLYFVIRKIHEELVEKRGQAGLWPGNLLARVFGFELLMAPYVVAHLKLGLLLKELGATLGREERLQVYLNNTLEEGVSWSEVLETLGYYIAEEANSAARVKKQEDIMVVLGNPPYSGHSANASVDAQGNPNFIGKLLHEYYFVDGAPLGERQPKWLQDDYVKFIRFGEWRIQQTGHGILALITNHGYLDNPTFRGMRQHLMKTFDEIYVLDLHGNSKKKEHTPAGGKDENVFDIQQGVAILLAIKNPVGAGSPRPGRQDAAPTVKHASLWGLREGKYAALQNSNLNDIEWAELQPSQPSYLFIEQDTNVQQEYEQGWKISDIAIESNVGFVSARDKFVIDFDENELRHRINDLRADEKSLSTREFAQQYDLRDTSSWNIQEGRNKIRKNINWASGFTKCFYRPFDKRNIYYSLDLLERPVYQIQRHMKSGNNLGFVYPRRVESSGSWQHLFCADAIIDHVCVSLKSVDYLFPLYIYTTPEETAGTLFAQAESTRQPNLAPRFIEEFSAKLGLQFVSDGKGDLQASFGPEDVFYYAYAVFHSPTYRARYAEFLKIDFPRLPLTGDKKLFAALAALGEELVGLHLLKSPKVDDFISTYPVAGDNVVEKVQYASGNIWINTAQYFGNVPENVWEFKVGGYQVCEKWLKDRKGRALSSDDLHHYQRVVVALQETIRLMGEVDAVIEVHGGWPVKSDRAA